MKFLLKIIITILFIPLSLLADESKKRKNYFSLSAGSFVYHVYNPNDTKYTEFFDNKFFSASVRITDSSEIAVGSLLNSYGNRCAFLGLEKNWYDFNDKLSFDGLYSYSGEFFFDAFEKCKNQGAYKRFEESTGLGFAPYIYHGLEYDVTSIMSLKAGLILPGLAVATIKWRF